MTRLTVLATAAALFGPSLFAQRDYPCKCMQKPRYNSSQLALGAPSALTNQVAITTMWASGAGPLLSNQDLVIYNIGNPTVPVNTNWASDPYYSDARWNYQNLGDVFGMTLDDSGNIYLAASTLYATRRTGYLANPTWIDKSGDHGQIYKIDNITGNPSPFFQLPNKHGAGLGNITYDCQHGSNFYVANLDDGLIYQLGLNKFSKVTVLGTWDHGKNLSTAVDRFGNNLKRTNSNPLPNNAAQFGRRPFAVRVFDGRLYYSIWNMDTDHGGSRPNEIWSVAIDGGGFISGPARLEIIMPFLNPITAPRNNPVTDITFAASGYLMAAERTISLTGMGASRVLEFGQIWDSTTAYHYEQSLTTYSVGCQVGVGGVYANATGGVDTDHTQATYRVWATGTKLHSNNTAQMDTLDGLQGFWFAGGGTSTSYLIDLDGFVSTNPFQDSQPGNVKIPCPPAGPAL